MIADFPDPAAGSDAEATYRIDAIARLVAAAHEAGARVAVHSTVPDAGQLVAVGVDSVEHGFGLDERAVRDMADRGTAWTPTVGALLALLDAPGMTPERRHRLQEGRARVAGLLPLAVRLGVPVLAGTDVTGSIPGEVALLLPRWGWSRKTRWPRRAPGLAGSSATRIPPTSSPMASTSVPLSNTRSSMGCAEWGRTVPSAGPRPGPSA